MSLKVSIKCSLEQCYCFIGVNTQTQKGEMTYPKITSLGQLGYRVPLRGD